jgi:hypothetical protein
MSDRAGHLDDPGQPGQRARDRESQKDQLVGIETAEARRTGGGADHPNFEALDGAPQQDARRGDDDQRNHCAEMEAAAFDQHRHGGDRIEFRGGREIESSRIAPGTAHHVVEEKIRHIHQHQAGENLAGAEPDFADRRDQRVKCTGRGTEQQHRGKYPGPGVGAVRFHRQPTAGDGADQELSFGADVPDVGKIAQRQTNGDHHQRCRFDRDFLQ